MYGSLGGASVMVIPKFIEYLNRKTGSSWGVSLTERERSGGLPKVNCFTADHFEK